MSRRTVLLLGPVAAVAFLLGSITGPMFAGTALAPITLQPGEQITIIAALPATPEPTPTAAPTPVPTPVPTPTVAPTAAPTPTPSPTPSPAPTATPAPTPTPPTGVYPVPSSIDATGTTEVTAALNAWLATVPNNSTVRFAAGGTYRLGQGIQLANRTGLTLDGNGATLRTAGTGNLNSLIILGHQYGGVWTGTNRNIVIRNFILAGAQSSPVLTGNEHQHGVQVENSVNVEVANVTIRGVYGDGIKSGADGVWFHDSRIESAGRNAITVTSGSGVIAERLTIGSVGYCIFDVEPNSASESARNIIFRDSTAVSWANVFAAVEGSHTGATIDGVTVSGVSISGKSLFTIIDNGGTSRMKNIVFTNNTSAKAAAGPVLRFAHIDGLTVTGNVQPLTSGVLASIVDCTAVVYAP